MEFCPINRQTPRFVHISDLASKRNLRNHRGSNRLLMRTSLRLIQTIRIEAWIIHEIFCFYSNMAERPKLRWRLYAISGSILLLAVIEHILSIADNSKHYVWKSDSENATFQHFLHAYCVSSHAFILQTGEWSVFSRSLFVDLKSLTDSRPRIVLECPR